MKNQAFLISLLLYASCLCAQRSSQCDTLTFQSKEAKVVGYFYPAVDTGTHTLLFTQGFMETSDIWGLCHFLASQNINVLTFDYRGCFESEGTQSLLNGQEDLAAAIQFLSSEKMKEKYGVDTSNLVIGGYSYGGHMAMLYAIHHSEIKKVVSISGGDLGSFAEILQENTSLQEGYAGFFESIRKPKGPVNFEYEQPLEELLQNPTFFDLKRQADHLSGTSIFLTVGLDDNIVSLEAQMLPLYRSLKKNKGQAVQMKVYNCGHSYRGAEDQLKRDLLNWLNDQ